jgi:hypothetical protein
MRSAALAERERVQRELARVDARVEALAGELAALDAAREELRGQLRVLNRFAHDSAPDTESNGGRRLRAVAASHGDSDADHVPLRGAQIREAAVRVLAGSPDAEAPVHYRTWFELLLGQGFLPAGRDPVATFLTQLGRSPVVERTSAAGTYRLDFSYPRRARARLADLRAALHATHALSEDADVAGIADARKRRAELMSEIEATERHLQEALRSLGDNLEQGP